MYLNKHKKEQKTAVRLLKERDKLITLKWSIKPIKLDTPIQHGYVRYLELRDDVKSRPDYLKILEIFQFLGQNKVYHQSEDFCNFVKKQKHELHAGLKSIKDPRFKFYIREELRTKDLETIEKLNKYLKYHINIYTCDCPHSNEIPLRWHQHIPHYVFAYPWMLQEITKPHYLTHYTPIQGDIESRLHEISKQLNDNHYYEKFFNNRRTCDKIYNQSYISMKYDYDKSKIYHNLDEDYFINGCIDLPSKEGV